MMKRIISSILVVLGILLIWPCQALATGANNPDSYWSETNAPEFYGTTAIVLKVGAEFDISDTRYRILARDFEDNDLTHAIEVTKNDVDPDVAGDYEVCYAVSDSHGNTTVLTVPVLVTEEEGVNPSIQRTLFTLPSMSNMAAAGTQRANGGDRQHLGVYMPADSTVNFRVVSGGKALSLDSMTNDGHKQPRATLKKDGTVAEISRTFGSVPFIVTQSGNNFEEPLVVELEFVDDSVTELDYYHYLDDEDEFFEQWRANDGAYAVIENSYVTVLVPYTDNNRLLNPTYFNHAFDHLDEFLFYWEEAVEFLDLCLGLDYNPVHLTDQNVRSRYFVKADAHGAGSAYYGLSHVGINSPSVASFFQRNWGGLHEFAHGYQGSLARNGMDLVEVSNNFLGHYFQYYSVYSDRFSTNYTFHNMGLGLLDNVEESHNRTRLNGGRFSNADYFTQLYALVNLFDSFEAEVTYAKINQYYRQVVNSGRSMKNYDAYVRAIAEEYNVNAAPYLEAWGVSVSDQLKAELWSAGYPAVSILKDVVADDNICGIIKQENELQADYTLVTSEILRQYNINGDLTLNIEIDQIENILGKYIYILDGDEVIRSIAVTSSVMTIDSLPIGTYYLQMPTPTGMYTFSSDYLTIVNGENSLDFVYTPAGEQSFANNMWLGIKGIYDTYGFKITLDNTSVAKIYLGGASLGNRNSAWQQKPDVKYAGVTIYDNENTAVYTQNVYGNNYFSLTNQNSTLEIADGYRVEIYHVAPANYVKVFSTLEGKELRDYRTTEVTTVYTIRGGRFEKGGMTQEQIDEIKYQNLRTVLVAQIENYRNRASEEELNNRYLNAEEKNEVIAAISFLREEDAAPYAELRERIIKGGIPTLTPKNPAPVFYLGYNLDLYKLVTAADNEDGELAVNATTTQITGTVDISVVGVYPITYSIADSDGNRGQLELLVTVAAPLANSINQVTVNIEQPQVGGTPQQAAVVEGEACVSSQLSWSPVAEAFAYNTAYSAAFTLTPAEGYLLSAATVVLVEGAEVSANYDSESGCLEVTAAFAKTAAAAAADITTDQLPNATFEQEYSCALAASGSGTISWSLAKGALPEGLTLSPEGLISGTPTVVGIYNLTFKASNMAGASLRQLSLIIELPAGVTVATIGETGYTSLKEAVAAAESGDVITVVNDVYLTETISFSNKEVSIVSESGQEHHIYRMFSAGAMFNVSTGATLKLGDAAGSTGVIMVDGRLQEATGAIITTTANVYLYANAVLQNNINRNAGGAINGTSSNANLHIYGTIKNNTSKADGGAISSKGHTHIYNGALIENNQARNGGGLTNPGGGIIYMTGGVINDNSAQNNGGGLYLSGKFDFSGGTISNNSAVNGGGVYLYDCNQTGRAATFSGGSIEMNQAAKGVGVFVGDKTADSAFVLRGAVDIASMNDVHLSPGKRVYISNKLTRHSASNMITLSYDNPQNGHQLVAAANAVPLDELTSMLHTEGFTLKALNRGLVVSIPPITYDFSVSETAYVFDISSAQVAGGLIVMAEYEGGRMINLHTQPFALAAFPEQITVLKEEVGFTPSKIFLLESFGSMIPLDSCIIPTQTQQ